MPPKTLAPMKTGSKPKARAGSGKASTVNAMKCKSLSLPSGARGGASEGQSIATVRMTSRRLSVGCRVLAHPPGYRPREAKAIWHSVGRIRG